MLLAWGPDGETDETFLAGELAWADGYGAARAWRRGNALGQWVVPLGGGTALRLLATSHATRFAAAGALRQDDVRAGRVDFFGTLDAAQGGAGTRHQTLVEVRHDGLTQRAALCAFVARRSLTLRHDFTGYLLYREGDLIEQWHDATTLGGRGRYERDLVVPLLPRPITIETGVAWRHDLVDQRQRRLRPLDLTAHHEEVDARLRITDLGLYGDLRVSPLAFLDLRAGVRGEVLAVQVDDRLGQDGDSGRRDAQGMFIAPRVTATARALEALRLYASYGRGFRSPQALSLGHGEEAPFTVVDSGELGLRFVPLPSVRTTLAGFVTYVAEDRVFDHATGRSLFSGATTRGGLAWHVEARPWAWLHATTSGTWTRALARTGARADLVPFVPTLVLRFDLDVDHELGPLWGQPARVFGGLAVSVVGPRPLPYAERTRAVAVTDLSLGGALGPIALSSEISNLFDSRWREGEFVYASSFEPTAPRSLVPARHFTAGAPFTLQLTLTVRL
jgi:outer membrane receptor protein involved in Fe transport